MDDTENLISVSLLVLIPAIVFFLLRRLKLAARITYTLLALLMAAYALPGWFPARKTIAQNRCIHNLRMIEDVKDEWARANHKLPTDIPTEADLVDTNKYFHSMPVCPRGGTYTLGAVNQKPACSLAEQGHKLE
jgi:hypothetical protein